MTFDTGQIAVEAFTCLLIGIPSYLQYPGGRLSLEHSDV